MISPFVLNLHFLSCPLAIKPGNGKSPWKIIYNWGIVHCNFWWPDGKLITYYIPMTFRLWLFNPCLFLFSRHHYISSFFFYSAHMYCASHNFERSWLRLNIPLLSWYPITILVIVLCLSHYYPMIMPISSHVWLTWLTFYGLVHIGRSSCYYPFHSYYHVCIYIYM